MSQYSHPINAEFSAVMLRENNVSDIDVDCIMLDNFRGLQGTITIETREGEPGNVRPITQSWHGEHHWMDFADSHGFAIIPTNSEAAARVIRSINAKLKESKQ